jgi:hypothetical protein
MSLLRFGLREMTKAQRSAAAIKAHTTMRAKGIGPYAKKGAEPSGPTPKLGSTHAKRSARAVVQSAHSQSYRAAYRSAERSVRSDGSRTGIEHLVAHDAKGALIGTNKGTKTFVAYPPGTGHLLVKPNANLIFHHNHPSSSTLSTFRRKTSAFMPGM